MILTKKNNYSFPAEFFNDYRESFNQEEFLKMEQPKEKSRWWETDSLLTSKYVQKEYFELGRSIKKDDYNIRGDIGGEMHYLKGTIRLIGQQMERDHRIFLKTKFM